MGKIVELDDREEIRRIADNPDVEVRIRDAVVDAVVDAVAKSVSREFESTVREAVRNEVEAMSRQPVDNGIFAASTPDDIIGPKLSKAIRDEIVRYLKLYVNETIHDAVEELDVFRAVREAVKNKVESIRNYDIESAVRSEARNLCRSLLEIVDGRCGKESERDVDARAGRCDDSSETEFRPPCRDRLVKWIDVPTEMTYATESPRNDEILAYGTYRGVEIMVASVRGSHMCGYARVDGLLVNSPGISTSGFSWIECHGGVTYAGNGCYGKEGLWIGWDYGHDGDFVAEYYRYHGVLIGPRLTDVFCGRKWTVDEVVGECLSVVDQLLDSKNAEKL